jgi:hypothetical protein
MAPVNKMTSERGNALVLAVLILLALSSVGIVSIQRTNMDLMVTGNVVRAMQARTGGEAGTVHGLGLVGGKPHEYVGRLEAQRLMAMGASGVSAPDGVDASQKLSQQVFAYSSAVPDYMGVDRPQHLPTVDGANTMARKRQDIAYDLGVVYVGYSKGWPGYDVDADICHNKFDFNARGGIPSGIESVAQTLPDMSGLNPICADTVVVENRARAVAGPVRCGK